MAVKIKLKRLGKVRNPQYRIVVADARAKRDGRAIEEIGLYHPKEEPSLIVVDSERAQYWLGVGAQPTEPVMVLLKITGDWQKFKGLPGAEGTLRVAEVAPDKRVVFAEALKDAAAAKDEQGKSVKPVLAPATDAPAAKAEAHDAEVAEELADEKLATAEAEVAAGVSTESLAEVAADEAVTEGQAQADVTEAVESAVEAAPEAGADAAATTEA